MGNNLTFLVTVMVKATMVGMTILIILTLMGFTILAPIINAIFSPEPSPGMYSLGPNFGRYTNAMADLYIFSTCIASFISGFMIRYWGRKTGSYFWQSFISGFIIGGIGPLLFLTSDLVRVFLFFFLFQDRLFIVNEYMTGLMYSLFSALIGLLGYSVANYRGVS